MLLGAYQVSEQTLDKLIGRVLADDFGPGECDNSNSWTKELGSFSRNLPKLHFQVIPSPSKNLILGRV